MKKTGKIIWGVAFIAAGIVFALNAFGITHIELFFDGWWTLFIIVPCLVGLFSEGEKLGNIIGIAIGVFLLLCCQNVLDFDMLWKIAAPAIVVLIGIKLIIGAIMGDKEKLVLLGSREDYCIGIDKGIGEARLEGESMRDDSVYGAGSNRLSIDGGVGAVNIEFSEETVKSF